MENHQFCSGWPDENGSNWANECPSALNKEDSSLFGEIKEEDGAATSASKSHSQAEKRRRDRINAQLAALRKLIPMSDKMDKAALLGSVVEQVKDLKRKAQEVSQLITVPTEIDEVSIECCLDQGIGMCSTDNTKIKNATVFIKVSVCCDDRPELFSELAGALKALKLTAVRADMVCLGGRIRSILVLCTDDGREGVCTNNIKQSLNRELSRIASSSSSSSSGTNYRMTSKRQKFFLPSYESR